MRSRRAGSAGPVRSLDFTLNEMESYWSILSRTVTRSKGGLLLLPNFLPVPNIIPWRKRGNSL